MASEKYDVLDYLQSSGTQYINVGLTGNRNTKFECKVNKATASSNNSITIFGNMEDESYSAGRISFNLSTNSTQRNTRLGDGSNDNIAGTKSISLNTIHTVILSRNGLFIDGTNIPNNNGGQTLEGSDFTCGTLYLFAINGLLSQPNWFNGNTRIYYAKIWDGDTLVRDFVPVKRKLDSVLGMYDLVNKEFYTNAGTGTFTAGNVTGYFCETSVSPEGTGTTSGDGIYTSGSSVTLTANPNSGYKFSNWVLKGYTKLSYIESTGTQNIDTGISFTANPTNKTGLDVKFNPRVVTGQTCLCGCENNGNRWNFAMQFYNGVIRTYHGTLESWQPVSITANQDYTLSIFQENGTLTRTLNDTTVTASTGMSIPSRTFTLFADSTTNYGYNQFSSVRIYYCKIYDNGVLICDYIPVIRHSDSQMGLLDLVNMKFYKSNTSYPFNGGSL